MYVRAHTGINKCLKSDANVGTKPGKERTECGPGNSGTERVSDRVSVPRQQKKNERKQSRPRQQRERGNNEGSITQSSSQREVFTVDMGKSRRNTRSREGKVWQKRGGREREQGEGREDGKRVEGEGESINRSYQNTGSRTQPKQRRNVQSDRSDGDWRREGGRREERERHKTPAIKQTEREQERKGDENLLEEDRKESPAVDGQEMAAASMKKEERRNEQQINGNQRRPREKERPSRRRGRGVEREGRREVESKDSTLDEGVSMPPQVPDTKDQRTAKPKGSGNQTKKRNSKCCIGYPS